MKRIAIPVVVLAMLGYVALAGGDWKEYSAKVNTTAVDGIYEDGVKFYDKWMETTKNERENIRKAYADAYKNAMGRLILDFGKTVAPVVRNFADTMKYGEVN